MNDVTTMEVKTVINSLKHANTGPDEFPAFAGKECMDNIIELLTLYCIVLYCNVLYYEEGVNKYFF